MKFISRGLPGRCEVEANIRCVMSVQGKCATEGPNELLCIITPIKGKDDVSIVFVWGALR